MTLGSARASTVRKLNNAAWIRRHIAQLGTRSVQRRGAIDAHRDAIRVAKHLTAYAGGMDGATA